jgi:hypothetical protein
MDEILSANRRELEDLDATRKQLSDEVDSLTAKIAGADILASVEMRTRRSAMLEAVSDADRRMTDLRERIGRLENDVRRRDADLRISELLVAYDQERTRLIEKLDEVDGVLRAEVIPSLARMNEHAQEAKKLEKDVLRGHRSFRTPLAIAPWVLPGSMAEGHKLMELIELGGTGD